MHVLMQKRDRVARVTLDRPPLNVLNLTMLQELKAVINSLETDPAIDLLIISGAGGRAFSAGVDIKDHTREKAPAMLETVHGVIRTLLALPQITVAAVRGVCLGGGCELASSCDFIFATEDSFFATPEINVGCYPPVALARFPGQLGYRRAAEMILTGRKVSAHEALAMGLINRVTPPDKLEQELNGLADELRGKSRAVLRITLKGLREISLKTFPQALSRSEEIYLEELLKTEDVEEGVKSFLEKRPPQWSHR
jgi:cyclohexa-1,5-dienecarbonyl-CoA hydratase